MHLYRVKTSHLVSKIFYPSLNWEIKTKQKKIFLTFDDGPTPGVTEEVLSLLEKHQAKATFFLIGDKAARYPDLVLKIREAGHTIGNHTYNHLKGWKTNSDIYLQNIEKCNSILNSSLFRPPYGKIKSSQIRALKKQYHIIMWSVLSGDFDRSITPQQCYSNVEKNTTKGSIIVFHDSEKAKERMLYALPKTLEKLSSQGYSFDKISFSR
ncbi:MAG: polysaccharide deacetylase family protein [Bacteroidota bacterium]|nr:polysaccharide deacetylase family protein [Bacteroidota bacterium]